MKKLLTIVACVATLAFTSCQYDDSAIWEKFDEYGETIKDHENRISALEELCKQMNTNISALQAIVEALQNNDYVTGVIPVTKDGVIIGYTITFTKSQPITIYHGEDGKDGADGANGKDGQDGKDGKDGRDGYTPQIGVAQDKDGIYYWTLDGEWLLDAQGNKIKAVGTDGKDGADGQDGKDGQDGITPRLKIENDYWYISYDNGATWEQLGKATGENGKDGQDGQNGSNGQNGADGKDGQDGDSFFQSITQDDDFVYFTLADGTVITLPKYKEDVVSENCKIYYTTSDGKKMFPKTDAGLYGAILISNTYKDGQGVLTFDEAVTSIGESAFKGCSSLTSVTIPDSVTEIGSSAFYYCSSLTSVTIGNSVTSIGDYAFSDCSSLTSVTIPDSVTEIEEGAFAGCSSLTSVTIPDSVTSIGYAAFVGCSSLKAFYGKFAADNGRCLIKDNAIIAYAEGSGTTYTIPDSVTEIGGVAFYGCYKLTSVTIGNSVTSIGDYAFYNCSSLTSVTIPDSVTSIGYGAFVYCSSLKYVYCKPTTPPTGGYCMFDDNASGRKIYVPRESVEAYKAKQYWSEYASNIVGYDF